MQVDGRSVFKIPFSLFPFNHFPMKVTSARAAKIIRERAANSARAGLIEVIKFRFERVARGEKPRRSKDNRFVKNSSRKWKSFKWIGPSRERQEAFGGIGNFSRVFGRAARQMAEGNKVGLH